MPNIVRLAFLTMSFFLPTINVLSTALNSTIPVQAYAIPAKHRVSSVYQPHSVFLVKDFSYQTIHVFLFAPVGRLEIHRPCIVLLATSLFVRSAFNHPLSVHHVMVF
jgi:hypothetical protein